MKRKSYTSPTFFCVVIGLLAIATCIFALSERKARSQLQKLWGESSDSERALDMQSAEVDRGFNHFCDVLANLCTQNANDERMLSGESKRALEHATTYFEDFIQNNLENERMLPAVARAYHMLGRVYVQQSRVALAELVFREAKRRLSNLNWDGPEFTFQVALNDIYLGVLLADLGQINEAHEVCIDARHRLERLASSHPNQSQYQIAFADVLTNLALLPVGDNHPAESESLLQLALETLAGISTSDEKLKQLCLAKRVDAQQLLASRLGRSGRIKDAISTCEMSLKLIEQLFNEHEERTLPGDLVAASQTVRANQRAMKEHVESGSSTDITDWVWRPLCGRSEAMMRSDSFVVGQAIAEFEKQDALLVAFPRKAAKWWLPVMKRVIRESWRQISIVILVPDESIEEFLAVELSAIGVPRTALRFVHIATDCVWVRDYGPIAVVTDEGIIRWVDAQYDYERDFDERVPGRLARRMQVPNLNSLLNIEAGNLIFNGGGLCLATKKVLRKNSELGFSESQVTSFIMRVFGATQVIYLDELKDEETGHVDWFATFVDHNTVVVGDYSGNDQENAEILDRNANRLKGLPTSTGPLKVVRIPMPPRRTDFFGGTYTNVVFANGILLVPTWNNASGETEKQVLATYQRLLPGWKIVAIDASEMGPQEGALRCATMPLKGIAPEILRSRTAVAASIN